MTKVADAEEVLFALGRTAAAGSQKNIRGTPMSSACARGMSAKFQTKSGTKEEADEFSFREEDEFD